MMENFKSVVNNSGNSFGQMTKLDANGDMIPVRYACFAVEEISGTPRWNLKEMFVISTTLGIVTVDATSSMTRDTGDAFIGAVLPLTGVDSELGASAFKAINLALEHASNYYKLAEGLNINFKLEIRDSASDPATALAQVKSLHEMGINLLIGPTSNGELAAVREYVKANGIIILSTTSTASSLAMADDRILRLTPDDTRQAKALSRLMIAQNKQHIIVIYRNDRYGQESVMTFSGLFQGNIDRFAYETNDTDFSSVLKRAASRIQEIGTPGNTAVLVIGNSEIIKLLEQVPDGPLTSVDWYGTDGISKSRDLLASTRAVAVAEQTHLTCSTYDLAAMPYFVPQHYALETYITPLLKVPSTWNEISAYDALCDAGGVGRDRLRPAEGAAVQSLVEQAQASAVEEEHLDRVAAPSAEHEERPAAGRLPEPLADQAREAIEAPAQVDRLDANEHLDAVRNHRATPPRNSSSTARTVATS